MGTGSNQFLLSGVAVAKKSLEIAVFPRQLLQKTWWCDSFSLSLSLSPPNRLLTIYTLTFKPKKSICALSYLLPTIGIQDYTFLGQLMLRKHGRNALIGIYLVLHKEKGEIQL